MITAHFPSLGTPGHAAFELGSQRHLTPRGSTSRYPQGRTWLQDGPYWAPMNGAPMNGAPMNRAPMNGAFEKGNWDPFNLAQNSPILSNDVVTWSPFCWGGATVLAWLHEWAPNQEFWKHWPTDRTSKPWALDLRYVWKQKHAQLKNTSSKDIPTVPNGDTLPETNSSHLNMWMVGIRSFPFGMAYFQVLC